MSPPLTAVSQLEPMIKRLGDGQAMAYVEAGEGDHVLVLVHGSLCDYRYWSPQLIALSATHRVVAPSLSHHHPRLASAAHTPFSWALHARQLSEFIGRLGVERVHLVGHSRGAAVAFHAALQVPQQMASLTLIDPGGPIENEPLDSRVEQALALRRHAVELIERGDTEEAMRLFVDSVSEPGLWDRSPPLFRQMARENAHTLGPQLADPLPAYVEQQARRIDCAALLIAGERSPAPYRRDAARLATWMPRAQHAIIEGASHGMTLTHSQRFHRILLGFLAGLAR